MELHSMLQEARQWEFYHASLEKRGGQWIAREEWPIYTE